MVNGLRAAVVTALVIGLTGCTAVSTRPDGRTGVESYVTPNAERYFRIELEPHQSKRGFAVEGYIYNTYGASADRVMVRVDGLDSNGTVLSRTTRYITGGVPRFGRSYFQIRVPAGAATYRMTILSFDWINGGGGGGA